jgi:hypothetical protein
MLHALLIAVVTAAVVLAAAAMLVVGLLRVIDMLDNEPGPRGRRRRGGGWDGPPCRFGRRRQPAWWPEFERAFADYVRDGARRAS